MDFKDFVGSAVNPVQKIEKKLFGNDVTRALDPALWYAVNQGQEQANKGLGIPGAPPPPGTSNLGGTPAIADETAAASKKKGQRDLNRKRQGTAGSGSTLLVDDEDQALEKSTLLGL